MSSPLIWVIFPAVVALGLYLVRDHERLVIVAGALTALLLAGLAWQLPIDTPIDIGPWSFKVADTLNVLGRRLVIGSPEGAFLVLFYLLVAFWFIGALGAGSNRLFVPLGLGMAAFLVAALAVEPFLYAALLIEIAVLLSIPILSPPGEPVGKGTLRYLILQTLAMPFILFTGWMLSGLETGPADPALIIRSEILLGFGFAFLLAVFPFYTWIPMLSEQAHPYVAGFIFVMVPTIALMFGLDFLDSYAWLRSSQEVFTVMLLTGTLMVITGGIWAAFQTHLGRMLGYAVIIETGLSLLAMGLGNQTGFDIFAMQFLPRILALGVWALALSVIRQRVGSLQFGAVRGLLFHMPVASVSLLLAAFSLAGLPFLASFPLRQALLEGVAQQNSLLAFWDLMGTLGVLAGGLRALAVFASPAAQESEPEPEGSTQAILLGAGSVALVLIGIFPQLFLPRLLGLLQAFSHLF